MEFEEYLSALGRLYVQGLTSRVSPQILQRFGGSLVLAAEDAEWIRNEEDAILGVFDTERSRERVEEIGRRRWREHRQLIMRRVAAGEQPMAALNGYMRAHNTRPQTVDQLNMMLPTTEWIGAQGRGGRHPRWLADLRARGARFLERMEQAREVGSDVFGSAAYIGTMSYRTGLDWSDATEEDREAALQAGRIGSTTGQLVTGLSLGVGQRQAYRAAGQPVERHRSPAADVRSVGPEARATSDPIGTAPRPPRSIPSARPVASASAPVPPAAPQTPATRQLTAPVPISDRERGLPAGTGTTRPRRGSRGARRERIGQARAAERQAAERDERELGEELAAERRATRQADEARTLQRSADQGARDIAESEIAREWEAEAQRGYRREQRARRSAQPPQSGRRGGQGGSARSGASGVVPRLPRAERPPVQEELRQSALRRIRQMEREAAHGRQTHLSVSTKEDKLTEFKTLLPQAGLPATRSGEYHEALVTRQRARRLHLDQETYVAGTRRLPGMGEPRGPTRQHGYEGFRRHDSARPDETGPRHRRDPNSQRVFTNYKSHWLRDAAECRRAAVDTVGQAINNVQALPPNSAIVIDFAYRVEPEHQPLILDILSSPRSHIVEVRFGFGTIVWDRVEHGWELRGTLRSR